MKLLTRSEEYVLLTVWRLQGDAYSVSICKHLTAATQKPWSLGAVYMPLERLEKRGLLTSRLSEITPDRGGRPKRLYTLTRKGKQALLHVQTIQQTMWAGLPNLALDPR